VARLCSHAQSRSFVSYSRDRVTQIDKSPKGITAKRANARLALTGTPFWQEESYDHLVRNEREF